HAVNELIEEQLGRPLADEEKRPEVRLERIGLDSLERMDVVLRIEDRFGFHTDQATDTLGKLWALADGLLTGTGEAVREAPPAWNRPVHRTGPTEVLADTLPAAFVRRVFAHP